MQDRMSAKEYRLQMGADLEEPENPYAKDTVFELEVADIKILNRKEIKERADKWPLKPMMPQPTEHQIQSDILDRLGLLHGAFFWRENSGLVNVGEGDKKRMFRAGIKGIPDIMGVYQGYSVGIEVKRPGKKQSIEQIAFQQRFDQCGGIYLVCTDSSQVVNQIMTAIAVKKGE